MIDAKNDNQPDSQPLQGEDLGPCPFCGLNIAYGLSPIDGAPDSLLHELPTCAKFDELEIDKFATELRKSLERQQQP